MRLPPMLRAALCGLALVALTACPTPDRGPHKFGVTLSPLTVAAWWIDPANSTGCAGDTNTGLQATCTGGGTGPFRTWAGLVQQWCPNQSVASCCPRFQQTVTVTFLSSHVDATDPVYACANLEAPAGSATAPSLILTGTMTQVASGTTGTVTAKARASNQPLQTTFVITAPDGGGAPTLLPGMLVVNTTHASRAWINVVGSPNTITQPLAPWGGAGTAPTMAEVDTWANSDAVTINTVPNVNVVSIGGNVTDLNTTSFANGVYLTQLTVFDPNSAGDSLFTPMVISGNAGATIVEASVNRSVAVLTNQVGIPAAKFTNVDYSSAELNGPPSQGTGSGSAPNFNILAGQFRNTGFTGIFGNASIDKDTIVNAGNVNGGSFGFVFVPSGKTLNISGPAATTSTGVIYGTGTLNVSGAGRLGYKTGAGGAAAQFIGVTLQVNTKTVYLTVLPTSATGIVTGNTSLTAANLDTSFGATSGCALGLGAMICNSP